LFEFAVFLEMMLLFEIAARAIPHLLFKFAVFSVRLLYKEPKIQIPLRAFEFAILFSTVL